MTAAFVGTFEHSLDDKGRVVLPPTFRAKLGEGGFLTQYQRCLALWTPPAFDEVVSRLTDGVRAREINPNALRSFTATAAEVKPDAQGRISVAARLRDYARFSGEVILTGNYNHIELWAPEVWQEINADGSSSLEQAVGTMGIY